MEKTVFIILMAFVAITAFASDDINGDANRKKIDITETSPPRPHITDVQEPETYYYVNTEYLTISLDVSYYSEYTVTLSSGYACLDYIATSPVINIPVASLDDVVDIYIESFDYGCYEGVLDRSK